MTYKGGMEQNVPFRRPEDLEAHVDQLGRTLAKLEEMKLRLTEPQITPGEIVFRDPKDAYHHITLGAVLAAHEFSAQDSRRLDGLLSTSFDELEQLAADLADLDALMTPSDTVAQALVRFLSIAAGHLEARGRYAEWRRAFDQYEERTRSYLDKATEEDLEKLARRPVSRKQTELVRYTCACLHVKFPALANRRQAFEWLRDIGANPRFRGAVK